MLAERGNEPVFAEVLKKAEGTPFEYQSLSGNIDTKMFIMTGAENVCTQTLLDYRTLSLGLLSASSQRPPWLLVVGGRGRDGGVVGETHSPHPTPPRLLEHTHPESWKCLGIMSPGAALTRD